MNLRTLFASGLLIMAAAAYAEEEVLVGTDWAEAIIADREALSGRAIDPVYREQLIGELAVRPAAQLESELVGGIAAVPVTNLLFNPVVPCRIVDTRNWVKLLAGVPRRVFAASFGYSGQGGSNEDCGIPFGPTKAVMLNITTTQWSGKGNINAWPYDPSDPPQPLSSIANYGQVVGLSAIANAISLAICDSEQAEDNCGGGDLFFQSNTSDSHLVVDIVGYYTKAP